jgi:ABC-type spermidine/putrescine transport system permease subunit II
MCGCCAGLNSQRAVWPLGSFFSLLFSYGLCVVRLVLAAALRRVFRANTFPRCVLGAVVSHCG